MGYLLEFQDLKMARIGSAKKYPNFRNNCVSPGNVKTDINFNTGMLTVEEGAEGPVKLALLLDAAPPSGIAGKFLRYMGSINKPLFIDFY